MAPVSDLIQLGVIGGMLPLIFEETNPEFKEFMEAFQYHSIAGRMALYVVYILPLFAVTVIMIMAHKQRHNVAL